MLFACAHLLFEMAKFAFDAIDDRGHTIFNVARMIVPALFLWIAGTLPMWEVRCTSNIAGPKDAGVSSRRMGLLLTDSCRFHPLHFPVQRMTLPFGLGLHFLLLNQFLTLQRQGP